MPSPDYTDQLAAIEQRIVDLSAAVDADREAFERDVAAQNQRIEEKVALRKRATLALSIALGVLGLLLIGGLIGGYYVRNAANDAQEAVAQSNADRAARSKGSCVQFNINQHNTREAEVQGLVNTFAKFIPPGDTGKLDLFAAELRTNVEILLPYRDCSDEGIAAFLLHPPTDPNQGG